MGEKKEIWPNRGYYFIMKRNKPGFNDNIYKGRNKKKNLFFFK